MRSSLTKSLIEPPPIIKIIEHYGGKLIRSYSSWQKVKCPFHSDSHASAGVNIKENIFVCHGCGIKGNGFNVIKQHEGVRFNEAIKIAEDITGEVYQTLRKGHTLSRRVSDTTRDQSTDRRKDSIRSRR